VNDFEHKLMCITSKSKFIRSNRLYQDAPEKPKVQIKPQAKQGAI